MESRRLTRAEGERERERLAAPSQKGSQNLNKKGGCGGKDSEWPEVKGRQEEGRRNAKRKEMPGTCYAEEGGMNLPLSLALNCWESRKTEALGEEPETKRWGITLKTPDHTKQ